MDSLLSTWISPDLLEETAADSLQYVFSENKPFKHILIRTFLSQKKAKQLAAELRKEGFERKESDLFMLQQTQELKYSQNPVIREFYLLVTSKEFAQFMQNISGIKLRAGALDLAGSLYKPGDYLLCHDDQVSDRKIAYILYLSEDFSNKDGGALTLLDSYRGGPGEVVQRYFPLFNSLLFFEVSPVSFHEVEEVIGKKNRYAIGGWLH